MAKERERSRAYPIIDLETAYDLLSRHLGSLGKESLNRESLAKRLGYETGGSGMAARKIGALVQFGLLNRHSGQYSLNRLGIDLLRSRVDSPRFRSAIQASLERPALYRWILGRYRRVGRVPEGLAGILVREYGITIKASAEAVGVFLRSARFAEAIDSEGCFLEGDSSSSSERLLLESHSNTDSQGVSQSRIPPLDLPLTNRRKAQLIFPDIVTDDDIVMLEDRLRYELDKGGLRKYVQIDPRSIEGNVIPVGFGNRSGKPKI